VYLIALLSQPVLARLYSPADFGEFAFLNSVLAILLIASSGRYEAGIVLTRRPQQAKYLFQLAQLVLLGYILLLSTGIYLAPPVVVDYFEKEGSFFSYVWLIPLLVLFSGYWQIVYNWLLRFKKFTQLSYILVSQRLLIFAGALGATLLPFSGNGLILGLLIGFLAIFIISIFIQRQPLIVPVKSLRSYAYHFKDFPLYSVPTLLINLAFVHLPVIWLTFFYNPDNAGNYSLAYTLISVPAAFMDMSLGKMFYINLAQEKKENYYPLLKKHCRYYVIMLLPAVLIAFLWGKPLMLLLLGSNWGEAGKILSTIAPLMLIRGLSTLFMYVLAVIRRQSFSLILQVYQLAIWVLAFAIGLYFQDILISLKLAVLFSALLLIYTILKVLPLIYSSHDSHSHRTLAK
jgi:lipopolysaccharide exporter